MELEKTCIELEKILIAKGYKIAQVLNEGVSEQDIKAFFSDLPLAPTDELIDLYKWKNGVKYGDFTISESLLFSLGTLLSLEEGIKSYKTAMTNNIWNENFFPISSNGAGDFILIDLQKDSETFKQLFLGSPVLLLSEFPETVYDSLESLFESVLLCYKKEIYFFDDEGFQSNWDAEFQLCRVLNPKSDYWVEEE